MAKGTIGLLLVLSYSGLGQQNGPNPVSKELLDSTITNRIQLAAQAQRRGDFAEADAHIIRLMAVAPKDPRVLVFREANEKLKQRAGSLIPNGSAVAELENKRRADQEKATNLVESAKVEYKSGMWDKAEKQLKEAAQLDPGYLPTYYYLDLIHEQRARQEKLRKEGQ